MKLEDIQKYVPGTIYKRGLDYFERDYIEELTEFAPNKDAFGEIKGFQKALGEKAANALVEELKFMYPKRPALLDELGKV